MKFFKYKRLVFLVFIFTCIVVSIPIFFVLKQPKQTHHETIATAKVLKQKINHSKVKFTYPYYKNEVLDDYINTLINQEIETIKQSNDKQKVTMDYTTYLTYEQYISVNLTTHYKETQKNTYFTFDLNNNCILMLGDIFRGQYATMIENKDPQFQCDPSFSNLCIDDSNLYLYQNDNPLTLPFEEVKSYIKLENDCIPSNYPHDIKKPEKQTVDPNRPMIAFTFDDGPHHSNTMQVVDLFEQYNGKATFFVLGKLAKTYPDIIKNCYQKGFEIENHSYSHPNLTKLPIEDAYKEIHETNDIIFSLTGRDPEYLRPPGGAYNTEIKNISHMKIQLWNIDTLDWKHRNSNIVTQKIIEQAKDGKVILVHDIHASTIEGVRNALPILHEQGYQFVTLETLHEYKK